MPRRAHDGLHHTGRTHLADGCIKLLTCSCKTIVGCRQPQLLMCQLADTLAVHGQERGIGRGNHVEALLLQLHECRCCYCLHLGDNQVRLLFLNDLTQPCTVQHGKHIATMRYLHGGCVLIPIEGYHLHTIALQLDTHIFSQLTRPAQQSLLCHLRQRRPDLYHVSLPFSVYFRQRYDNSFYPTSF